MAISDDSVRLSLIVPPTDAEATPPTANENRTDSPAPNPAGGPLQADRAQGIRALLDGPASADGGSARERPSLIEAICGVIGLIAWICFFAAGALVSTEGWRGQLVGAAIVPAAATQAVKAAPINGFLAWILCVICYTVTNLFFLSCVSAFLGCMASRWPGVLLTSREEKTDISKSAEITHTEQTKLSPNVNELWKTPGRRVYPSAVLRGFFLYTVLIAGLLVISTESSIIQTTPAQYVRLAGFVSALAFIIGYDPDMIQRFIMRAKNASLPTSSS